MSFNLKYQEFNEEIAIEILRTSSYSNVYLEEYVKSLEEQEFYWFMEGLTN